MQRHILVKGCGKALHNSNMDSDRADGYISGSSKSGESSPVLAGSA